MKKIFVTGGHFAPAKAVIQELLIRGEWEIYYIGRKYSMEGSNQLALEYSEIPTLSGVHYLTITAGRLQRQFFANIAQSIVSFLKIFVGLTQSLVWIVVYRPNMVMSFGGYVAVPVVFWAWIFRIPIITHEQTTVSGRANRFIALLADKILVSWPESLKYFPRDKAILMGNPLRQEVVQAGSNKQITVDKKPVIYITGGSQGAQAIDEVVEKVLPKLSKKYEIISGRLSGVESAKSLAEADLIVSRAGANTITEILYFGKPAILIPLPHTYGNEQKKNAQLVVASGLGKILLQKNLTAQSLVEMINEMIKNRDKYLVNGKNGRKLISPNAAAKIVGVIEKVYQ